MYGSLLLSWKKNKRGRYFTRHNSPWARIHSQQRWIGASYVAVVRAAPAFARDRSRCINNAAALHFCNAYRPVFGSSHRARSTRYATRLLMLRPSSCDRCSIRENTTPLNTTVSRWVVVRLFLRASMRTWVRPCDVVTDPPHGTHVLSVAGHTKRPRGSSPQGHMPWMHPR